MKHNAVPTKLAAFCLLVLLFPESKFDYCHCLVSLEGLFLISAEGREDDRTADLMWCRITLIFQHPNFDHLHHIYLTMPVTPYHRAALGGISTKQGKGAGRVNNTFDSLF
jgi:hypothetical protein